MSATPTLLLAGLLALAALVAVVRVLRANRPHRLALAALQPVLALLLFFALDAPAPRAGGTLVVLGAGATEAQSGALAQGDARVVALPEANAPPAVERVPDLATALRRHAGVDALRIVGHGLGPRDIESARGLPVAFDRAPPPSGLVELDAPAVVAQGRRFVVAGRVEGVAGGTIELRDPGDAIVASAPLAATGRFVLEARARVAGPAVFRARVLDREGALHDDTVLPLDVIAPAALRVGVLAGGPSPELKYLRRWARDAGHALASRLSLSPGIEMVDAPLELHADALRELDVLVADERGWAAAGAAEREAIVAAARDGLGLALRVTGPVPARVSEEWRALGLAFEPDDTAASTASFGVGPDAPPALALVPLRMSAAEAASIAAGDATIAWWRPLGLGRIALWRALDTHRLVTAGRADLHGELWASLVETLARSRAAPAAVLRDRATVGRRTVACGLADGTTIAAPDGASVPLHVEDGCALWYPDAEGWHAVAGPDGAVATRFYAHAPGSPLDVAADARETLALAGVIRADAPRPAPDRRMLLLAAWLALAALAWWLERRALRAATP